MNDVGKTAAQLDAELAEVLDEYLLACAAGTAPPRAALLERHPELAEQLDACLSSLDFIRRATTAAPVGVHPAISEDGAAGRLSNTRTPVELGDYRLLREVGRGGMGIVYEAEQRSLGRRVALKLLPFAAALDPRQLQRFKNEAQAAALLQHPHIVPVFAVGSEKDVHFYVMRFIAGQTLAAVIGELRGFHEAGSAADREATTRLEMPLPHPRLQPPANPASPQGASGRDAPAPAASAQALNSTPGPGAGPQNETPRALRRSPLGLFLGLGIRDSSFFRTVANLGIQAAEALEHAHELGIIHRDIKPGNLLIDEQGHLWVTDFGLARFPTENGNLTLTGDLIGTLRYMSPEQAVAQHGLVDQRADIYSLGATLYELATLEPAVPGNDRHELLRKIAEEDPVAPHLLNKALPAPLETILLKALAKEPEKRYTAARLLADDLRRFLADEPISAQRPTLRERAGRWLRRHRRLVAGAVCAGLVALGVLAVGTFIVVQERNEAERRAQQAQQAVDEMYTQVAQRWWYQQPYMEQVQREFLEKALRFYEDFSREREDSPRWRLEAAKAARRVGDIQHRLGRDAPADAAYDLAFPRLTKLVADAPDQEEARDELANLYNNRANLRRERGQLAAAAEDYRAAHTLFADLVAKHPATAAYREGLAGTLGNLGMVDQALGRPDQAEKNYRQALELFVGLVKDNPGVPAFGHGLASCRNSLANLLRDTGRPREAQESYESALADWSKLARALPGMPNFRQGQAVSYSGLGIVYAALGRNQDAETAHRNALTLRVRLVDQYPGVPAYRQALGASQHNLARLRAAASSVAEARTLFTAAIAVRKQLAEEIPSVSTYRQELADSYEGLANLLASAGQLRQAADAQRQVKELRHLLTGTPEAQWDQARSERALGTILHRLGQWKAAEQCLVDSLKNIDKLASDFSDVAAFRLELAAAHSACAELYKEIVFPAPAEAHCRAALALRTKLAADFPAMPYYRLEVALGKIQLGDLLRHTGRRGEAETSLREALALAHKLHAELPAHAEYRRALALAQTQLGELLITTGKLADAEQALQHAHLLFDKLAAEFPAFPEYWRALAQLSHAFGNLRLRADRALEAEKSFQQELVQREKLAADFIEEIGLTLDLAYFLADCPHAKARQPQRAASIATGLLEQSERSPGLCALAEYRAGAFQKAVKILERTQQSSAQRAADWFVLALAHRRLMNDETAKKYYDRANTWIGQNHFTDENLERLHAEAKTILGLDRP